MVCLYAHVGILHQKRKILWKHQKRKLLWKPNNFLWSRAKHVENPAKEPNIPGAAGPKMWKNVGNVAIRKGKIQWKPKDFGWSRAKHVKKSSTICVRRWKLLKKPKILGAMGQKCGKCRNFASEKTKFCENLTLLGATGLEMWKNTGILLLEEGKLLWKTKDSCCNGGKNVGNFAPEKAKLCEESRILGACMHHYRGYFLGGAPTQAQCFWDEIAYFNSGDFICRGT